MCLHGVPRTFSLAIWSGTMPLLQFVEFVDQATMGAIVPTGPFHALITKIEVLKSQFFVSNTCWVKVPQPLYQLAFHTWWTWIARGAIIIIPMLLYGFMCASIGCFVANLATALSTNRAEQCLLDVVGLLVISVHGCSESLRYYAIRMVLDAINWRWVFST